MPFLLTKPMSSTVPIIENALSVSRVSAKAPIAPTTASGTDVMMMNGVM